MDDMMNKLQQVLSDEQSMEQIKKLAGMLSGEANMDNSDNSSSIGNQNCDHSNQEDDNVFNFDFDKLMKIQQIVSQVNQKDSNTQFLYALKPLLKNESQVKVDKIVKVLKLLAMWPVIKESGILGGDLFDLL